MLPYLAVNLKASVIYSIQFVGGRIQFFRLCLLPVFKGLDPASFVHIEKLVRLLYIMVSQKYLFASSRIKLGLHFSFLKHYIIPMSPNTQRIVITFSSISPKFFLYQVCYAKGTQAN